MDLTLNYDSSITDYTPVVQGMINQLITAGGIGTLYVTYGNYPLFSEITVKNPSGADRVRINIIGISDNQNRKPRFFDTRSGTDPHSFIVFRAHDDFARRLWGGVYNLEFEGNSIPYSSTHPWFLKSQYPRNAIHALGTLGFTMEDCIIRNQYGAGLVIANYFDQDKQNRCEYPVIRRNQIYNTWAWNPGDDTGDGIHVWNCNRPLIEDNTIINDLFVTRWIGRVGIVIEHLSEKALVQRNKVFGYDRTVHIECTYGGHIIQNNDFSGSKNHITLNEFCGALTEESSLSSPNLIYKNKLDYNQEQEQINASRNDFGMLSIVGVVDQLRGLRIIENEFTYRLHPSVNYKNRETKAIQKRPELYMVLKGQPGVVLSKNTFE
jgi:hypothetical protein